MYTVQELIEALEKCPQDYEIKLISDGCTLALECIGIDNNDNTVCLFAPEVDNAD
jgi:hypothetical protein